MRKIRMLFILAACWLAGLPALQAQTPVTDISKTGLAETISSSLQVAWLHPGQDLPTAYPQLSWTNGSPFKGSIPPASVGKTVLLRFRLSNSSDSMARCWFFPGYHYTRIRLYREEANRLTLLRDTLPAIPDSAGFRLVSVNAGDSITIVAELQQLKTHINSIRPRLIKDNFILLYLPGLRHRESGNDLMTYLFCGLLLMMILFSLTSFLQRGHRAFLYYSAYAFLLGSMLLTKTLFALRYHTTAFFFEAYLDFILQGAGIIFYLLFMQRFLETKKQHPFLWKLYNTGILLLGVSLAAYSFFYFAGNYFLQQYFVENATKLLLLALVLVFLVYSLRYRKDTLMRYLFWGNACLFLFSLISQAAVLHYAFIERLPGIFSSSVFYYEAGLFLELFFFLAGLNLKNRRLLIAQTKESESLKAQNQLKEYEKELAVYKAQQEERQRISADMHDELGSGLTAIRLFSEIAKNKMKTESPAELDRISVSADDVLNNMNAIIWSMNSGNDTLDNLVSYIRSWSIEYLENTSVACTVDMPASLPEKEISGDKRRNIFLCVKESLNNVLKHAACTAVHIRIQVNGELRIEIADNGKGIDLQNLRQFGNGLKNIQRRMQSIGGSFTIENRNGTVSTLRLPL